ncbi:hypothetical protein ES703_32017 [subsurface metagenome]
MTKEDLTIGGQAVIEGVMMRSPKFFTIALRKPDGDILVRKDPYIAITKRNRWLNIPILRGAIVLVESLYLGIKALTFSADQAMEEKVMEATSQAEHEIESKNKAFGLLWLILMVVLGLLLGVGLFFYLPLVITDFLGVRGGVLFNLVDGMLRIGIFLIYIWAIGLWKETRRIFEYHGAEHKSIATFEMGEELTVNNAKKHSTVHARCGTSFLVVVMMVSMCIFIFLGRPTTIAERLMRFLFIPLIGGISYEIIKASSRSSTRFIQILIKPGLWLQKLTTREPNSDQLEVAIVALKEALEKSKASPKVLDST